jgi:hypothetical protein
VKEAAILKEDAFAGKQVAYAKRKTVKCEAFWSRLAAR